MPDAEASPGSTRSSRSAPRIPSSASSSRTSPGAASGASPRVDGEGHLEALCHVGLERRPLGSGCAAFADVAAAGRARMVIGEEGAVTELWEAARDRLPTPREDRPGQPVYVLEDPPGAGRDRAAAGNAGRPRAARAGLRGGAPGGDRDRPARRATPRAFAGGRECRSKTGRSWLWTEEGTILFKAEASAWTPAGGAAPAGVGRPRRARPRATRSAGCATCAGSARARAERLPLRARRERARDPASTRRSACSGRSRTGRLIF